MAPGRAYAIARQRHEPIPPASVNGTIPRCSHPRRWGLTSASECSKGVCETVMSRAPGATHGVRARCSSRADPEVGRWSGRRCTGSADTARTYPSGPAVTPAATHGPIRRGYAVTMPPAPHRGEPRAGPGEHDAAQRTADRAPGCLPRTVGPRGRAPRPGGSRSLRRDRALGRMPGRRAGGAAGTRPGRCPGAGRTDHRPAGRHVAPVGAPVALHGAPRVAAAAPRCRCSSRGMVALGPVLGRTAPRAPAVARSERPHLPGQESAGTQPARQASAARPARPPTPLPPRHPTSPRAASGRVHASCRGPRPARRC